MNVAEKQQIPRPAALTIAGLAVTAAVASSLFTE